MSGGFALQGGGRCCGFTRGLGRWKGPAGLRAAEGSCLCFPPPIQPLPHGQGDLAGDIAVPVAAVQGGWARGARGVTGQPPASQWDPRAGDKEPKLPWDAEAVPAETAAGGSPGWGGSSRWERHSGLQRAADRFIFSFLAKNLNSLSEGKAGGEDGPGVLQALCLGSSPESQGRQSSQRRCHWLCPLGDTGAGTGTQL